jgi:hypothetical protein
MPDLGVTRQIAKEAVRAASKEAKVLRPNEVRAPRPPTVGLGQAAQPTVTPISAAEIPTPAAPVVEGVPMPAAEPPQLLRPSETDAVAQRLSKAQLGDYALDESFQTNFDAITTTDDIKAVIADVSHHNAGKIDEARRGVITNEQLRGLANDLDVDTEIVQAVLERESGGALSAETILGARQVLNSSAERLKTLGTKIAAGQATDMERIQFRRQMQFHDEYQTQFMGARAEAGRALNAFSIPVGSDAANLARLRETVDTMYGDTDQLARAMSQIDTAQGVNNFARKYNQSRMFGTLNELFVNSTLSGPTTHLVNTVGNVLMQSMNAFETAYAARIGRFLSSDERVEIGEATALLQGAIAGTRDGLRLAGRAMKSGKTIDEVSKYESAGNIKAISAQNWLKPEWQATPLGRTIDAIGTVIRVPTERIMAPTDEFFKTIAYRGELERQAFLHVQQQLDSGAITQAEAQRVARDFLENTPLTAQEAADEYAKYVTFQNTLGDAGRKAQLAIRAVPALGLVAPYIRTPINIFKAGLFDRSPVAFFTKKFYADLQKGGRTRDMALARVSLGSATAAFVAVQVMEGNISGAGPRNPDARALLWSTGWRPYSIRDPITGRWNSYARMEPIASVIGATADSIEIGSFINEDIDTMKDENQMRVDAAAAIIAGIANNTMSKTFMKGLSDFTETLSDPGRYAQNYGGEMATALVPYSAARRQIAKSMDPYMREAWEINDKLAVASGIPGWSEDAPPRRDLFGEPRKYARGWILGTMSPMPDSKEKQDPVLDELVSVMNATRQVPIAMPGKSIEGMRLTATEYDDFVRLSRSSPIFDGGESTFHDKVVDMMDSDVYLDATPFGRAELLKNLQFTADRIVSEQGGVLEQENIDFAERITLYRAKRARLRFGEELE